MYIPSAFAETRAKVLAEFIRANSFGTLVTSHPESGICASHLPFLASVGDGGGVATLLSHVARPNDQWRVLRGDVEVMAVFAGPHAYVSPRWYGAKLAVPTWNYTAVHVYGRPRLIEDPKEVRRVLSETVSTFEGTGPGAWRDADLPNEYVEKLAGAVVAFAIDVTRIEGKFKLNQNRPAADQASVAAALEAIGDENSVGVANLMGEGLGDNGG